MQKKQKPIKILDWDKDGSLTPQNGTFPRIVAEFLWILHQAGLILGPSSGKGAEFLRGAMFGLGFLPHFIIGDGGGIGLVKEGESFRKIIFAGDLSPIAKFADLIEYNKILGTFLFKNTKIKFLDEPKDTMLSMFPAPGAAIESSLAWETFFNAVINAYGLDVKVIAHGDGCIDVMLKMVAKDLALKFLCDYFGVDMSQIVTVVDGKNDYEMTQGGVFPICPVNAIPEIKDAVIKAGGMVASKEHGFGFIEMMIQLALQDRFEPKVNVAIIKFKKKHRL